MQQLPDYYKILDVLPSASFDEIKKAFRKLAHELHPDKTENSPEKKNAFLLLKEAYDILSNPIKRQDYHFKKFHEPLRLKEKTIAVLLDELNELQRLLIAIGHNSVDFDLLFFQLKEIVPTNISNLKIETEKNQSALEKSFFVCADFLPYHFFLKFNESRNQFVLILNEKEFQRYSLKRKINYLFDKAKIFIALLVAIAICILIFNSSKH